MPEVTLTTGCPSRGIFLIEKCDTTHNIISQKLLTKLQAPRFTFRGDMATTGTFFCCNIDKERNSLSSGVAVLP
jgi:hypothetical protein